MVPRRRNHHRYLLSRLNGSTRRGSMRTQSSFLRDSSGVFLRAYLDRDEGISRVVSSYLLDRLFRLDFVVFRVFFVRSRPRSRLVSRAFPVTSIHGCLTMGKATA